jgi:hypothetical protein
LEQIRMLRCREGKRLVTVNKQLTREQSPGGSRGEVEEEMILPSHPL